MTKAIEFQFEHQRGTFELQLAVTFAAPWTVVFGPSGAGKSTLLRLIAGLDTPVNGRIAIHGLYVLDTAIGLNLPPSQRAVGMVTQSPALFPHLTVEQNVAYGISKLDRDARKQRVAAMLDIAEASQLAYCPISALSGGEAQRVALARALAPNPAVLLLDEPFSALDGIARDSLLNRLHSCLADQRIQTILVTHDAADALATHAEVAILRDGKIAAQGPAEVALQEEKARLLRRLNPSAANP